MFGLRGQELLIVLLIVLLIFGARKLPDLARSIGASAKEFRKGIEDAKKNMFTVPLIEGTIPHAVLGEFSAGKVLLKPASPGTGIIAGGPVRALLELAGVRDVLSKSLGTDNAMNMVKAAL